MNRRRVLIAIGVTLSLPRRSLAQPVRVHKLAYLSGGTEATSATTRDAVLDGLHALGYVQGRDYTLDARYAESRFERLDSLASAMVAAGAELMLTQTTPATSAARRASATIPIVSITSGDLVGSKLAASLARPGGNVTGLSFLGTELAVKQMDILKSAVPKAKRVALVASRLFAPEVLFYQEMEKAAPRMGLTAQFVETSVPPDYRSVFAMLARERMDAIVVAPGNFNHAGWQDVLRLAVQARIPAIYPNAEAVDAGGLMSYGINRAVFYRRAATFVDRILKGARPADLPIEQPTQFEFVLNRNTARAMGVAFPDAILLRADRVVG